MKYLLMIYGNDEVWSSFGEGDLAEVIRRTEELHRQLRASGEFVGAYGVADQVNARTVRVRNGAPVVTDGPYVETKEYLGSFTIVDCDSLERALEIARSTRRPKASRSRCARS